MMISENLKSERAYRAIWSRMRTDLRGYRHLRRDGLSAAILSAIIFGYAYTDLGLGSFVDISAVPGTAAELLADIVIALAIGAGVTLGVHVAARCAKRMGVLRLWSDLRDNPRYAQYGMRSAILAVCVYAFWFYPTNLDFRTWINYILLPAPWAVYKSVFACGFGLAVIMGLIGAARADRRSRVFGVLGALVAANGLSMSATWQSLPAHLLSTADFVAWCVFGCLPSVVYEHSSGNLVLGVATFMIPFATIWIAFRCDVKRIVSSRVLRRHPMPL